MPLLLWPAEMKAVPALMIVWLRAMRERFAAKFCAGSRWRSKRKPFAASCSTLPDISATPTGPGSHEASAATPLSNQLKYMRQAAAQSAE